MSVCVWGGGGVFVSQRDCQGMSSKILFVKLNYMKTIYKWPHDIFKISTGMVMPRKKK